MRALLAALALTLLLAGSASACYCTSYCTDTGICSTICTNCTGR